MAPDSETTREKVKENLSDLTLSEICSLNQDLSFCVKDSSGRDKGENISNVHHNVNGLVADDDDGIPVPDVQLYPPGQVCLEWTEVHKIGAGLANLGNTCFLNTVIQCLTYCPPLANYLLQSDHSMNCKSFEFCMTCELQKHMRQVFQRSGDVIKPLGIYQNLKYIADHFQFGQQEDAHEFLRFVIDNLWQSSIYSHQNDMLDLASRETTIINRIFGGYHRSQVVCLQCNLKSDKYEHFMDFILDIQNVHSLEKAVEEFVKPELLENENSYKCPKCNALVPAEKTFTIHRPPNVATFQLKRFHCYRSYGKITKHISYPENFDLRPYMSQRKGGCLLYRLNAVLVHMGQNCNSGHYYCYIRNSNGFWYLMDDAKVQKVSLQDVLNQQAYVLFYVRSPNNGIHLKKTAVTSVIDFQYARTGKPDLPQPSSPKKDQLFLKTSKQTDNRRCENSSCSAVYSSSLPSQKHLNNTLTQHSISKFNSNFANHDNSKGSSISRCTPVSKFDNHKSSYDRRSAQKRIWREVQHQNVDLQYKKDSSGGRCLIPWSNYSSVHLSFCEKNSQDIEYLKKSSVCSYNVHNNKKCRSYENCTKERRNVKSATKYRTFARNGVDHNSFFPNKNLCASRNYYSYRRNVSYTCNHFTDGHQSSYHRGLGRSDGGQYGCKSSRGRFCTHKKYYTCKNDYINNGMQDYHYLENNYNTHMGRCVPFCTDFKDHQYNEQFSINHRQNELPRDIHHKTFSNGVHWHKFHEKSMCNSKHFSGRSERSSGFRNGFKKRFGNNRSWRKEHSTFPNFLKQHNYQVYQGHHSSSSPFPKYRICHHSCWFHDKCIYLNIS